ncbi:unnamed protein product [Symbiodinium sp. CCMP2592]|nr:unnamed protein product [Symbiodinium sp. CCMP2592]
MISDHRMGKASRRAYAANGGKLGGTPESRFALYAALLLCEEKRGGGGSSGRARRSLHLKIIGGYSSQLRERAVLSEADRENLGTADSYVSWLQQNTPERGAALPSFLASEAKRARLEEAAEHLENPLEIAAEPAEEAAEEILESAEEAAEETLDTGVPSTSSGAGPELRFRPVARRVTSLKVAEGLLPPGTSVLLSLDIHLVADRSEEGTAACLERILREHSDLAVIFCSYAVKQKTIDKAVQCIHRICDRTIVRRPLTFPIFFTSTKTAPGTGKGAQLSTLADIFSRSRPAPLTYLYHVDDQDPICKNVTSYGHHGVRWAEEDPRSLDQIVWELCWL